MNKHGLTMKELSIKEKAKAYDKALERAKKWYNAPNIDKIPTYGNRIIEEIFPELIESEDERIREEIINYFKCQSRDEPCRKSIHDKWIAWLEKQGNPTEINPSEFDLRLNKLLKQFETLPKEELASSLSFYLNVVQNDGTYREEKQGEQKHANKVEPKDYNGIDPYFGKPVDKVEPKFKVGDWVVENGVNGNPVQITSFEEDKGVGIKVWFSNGTGTWVDYLKGYHKWTIEDARDGDVLADNLGIILFKSIRDNNVINYYAYLSGLFSVQKDEEYWGYAINCKLSPATKAQRKRFFAAMHDAGYEFDFEKKKLKKIEQKPTDKVEPKFKAGNWYQCTKDFFGKGVTFDKNTAYYCAQEGCLQNEYGCHIAIVKDLYDNFKLWAIQDAKDGDILVASDDSIFIFGGVVDCACKYYVALTTCNDIKINKKVEGGYWETSIAVHPATKEQRDTLFAKMREAGYEWDAEKKELKKIENEIEIPFGAQDSELQEVSYYIPEGFHAEIDDNGVIIKKGKKPAAWSEEDSTHYDDICEILINLIHSETAKVNKDVVQRDLNWLTSIKQRIETK